MGNWRTVRMVGTCPDDQARALLDTITGDMMDPTFDWGPLVNTDGLAGLGPWPAAMIDRVGNLAERDFSVDDVADHLRELVKVAPDLSLKVHCGADWEEKNCIATVTVAVGEVSVGEPEVESVGEIPEDQVMANFAAALERSAVHQGQSKPSKAEALEYLAWLDAGNKGRHYEQQRASTEKGDDK